MHHSRHAVLYLEFLIAKLLLFETLVIDGANWAARENQKHKIRLAKFINNSSAGCTHICTRGLKEPNSSCVSNGGCFDKNVVYKYLLRFNPYLYLRGTKTLSCRSPVQTSSAKMQNTKTLSQNYILINMQNQIFVKYK